MKPYMDSALAQFRQMRRDNPHGTILADIWTMGGHYFDGLELVSFDPEEDSMRVLARDAYGRGCDQRHIDLDKVVAITLRPRR